MNDTFYTNGLRFSCTGCSACCRHDPGFVYLSNKDLIGLAGWAGMTSDDFVPAYCRWVSRNDGYEYLCLREKKNYDCILWKDGCIAYEARPLQCSSYPFWASNLMDEDWWDASAATCPGMNTGKLYTYEQITDILKQRTAEPYIRRRVSTSDEQEEVK